MFIKNVECLNFVKKIRFTPVFFAALVTQIVLLMNFYHQNILKNETSDTQLLEHQEKNVFCSISLQEVLSKILRGSHLLVICIRLISIHIVICLRSISHY